jgi:hypothetical protein
MPDALSWLLPLSARMPHEAMRQTAAIGGRKPLPLGVGAVGAVGA